MLVPLLVFALAGAQGTRMDAIGSALGDGMQLVYASGGEQAPWVYDSIRVVERAAFDRCVVVTRRSQAGRETCVRDGTLFEPDAAGTHVAVRPVGPGKELTVSTPAGNVLHYTTGEAAVRRAADRLDVPVIRTTILTRDAKGAIVRRLREDYAPSLLTAVWGVFEEPDGTGGWRAVREFTLVDVRYPPGPPTTPG